jgi:NTP pyrophosphatase (non-canonical NTP hydrolase)
MDIQKITSEIEKVSQIYTSKFNIERDSNWFVLKLQEELGELIQSYLMMTGKARTKDKTMEEIEDDFKSEVADVFSHILLLANFYKIDVEKVVEEKWLKWSK